MCNRRRMSNDRVSVTEKFEIYSYKEGEEKIECEGYFHLGFYDDGAPGELFLRIGKEGELVRCLGDAFATMFSIALQHGASVDVLLSKLKFSGYEPSGHTNRKERLRCSSVLDLVAHIIEEVCNRGQLDEPMAIRELKRFASDQVDIEQLEVPTVTRSDKKVAIIGSGPAGLAAANDLARKGHQVTIFEALPQPGGMLRVGIPEYRFPKAILGKEIDYIQKLGVEIRTGVQVGKDISLEGIRKNCDTLFIAVGAHGGMRLGLDGESLPGVIDGLGFLRAVNLGERVELGGKTVVIGGGNMAVDCARTAKRLGAEAVTVIYRRSQAEMPAFVEEVAALKEEGIRIEFLTMPTRFLPEDGRLAKMECIRMKLGEPDASGRPRPIPVEGSEFISPVDTVITAVGQTLKTEFARELGLSLSRGGMIVVDPESGATNVGGVFAGGDVVTGAAYVIDAIAAGKKAARSIDRYLQGEPIEVEEGEARPEKLSLEEVEDRKKRFPSQRRAEAKWEPTSERVEDFREVVLGYTPEEAVAEASRCLAGQMEGCIECHECEKRCELKAVAYTMQDEHIEVNVGAIVLATGLDLYDVSPLTEYRYGKIKNVITAMEFERLTAASGPTFGELKRPSDEKTPHNIAFIQCVGSRDFRHKAYCSRVCCMHASKEAILAYEHHPEVKSTIFYIDLRAEGKRFQEYITRAEEDYNVTYIRGRPGKIEVNPGNQNPIVWYEDTATTETKSLEVELVVLCQAMIPSRGSKELAEILGLELNEYGFVKTPNKLVYPLDTTKLGIFACGYVHSPGDIPESVVQGSGVAARAAEALAGGS